MLKVKRDSVSKEAIRIIVGIAPKGYKEVLDYRLFPQESTSNYKELLQDLKEHGCEGVL